VRVKVISQPAPDLLVALKLKGIVDASGPANTSGSLALVVRVTFVDAAGTMTLLDLPMQSAFTLVDGRVAYSTTASAQVQPLLGFAFPPCTSLEGVRRPARDRWDGPVVPVPASSQRRSRSTSTPCRVTARLTVVPFSESSACASVRTGPRSFVQGVMTRGAVVGMLVVATALGCGPAKTGYMERRWWGPVRYWQ
jgi:hypothetical protein